MPRFLKKFIRSEHGAVTVDWVVLTAAIVGLAVLISLAMQSGAVDLGDKVAAFMSNWTF
jgi:Flp pilus assembly pilin Flp